MTKIHQSWVKKSILRPAGKHLVFLICIALGLYLFPKVFFEKHTYPYSLMTPTPSIALKEIMIKNTTISIEIADTDAKRQKGLSGYTSLPTNQGMLFVFDRKPSNQVFWMKGMLMSIDIIWIKDSKVVQINKNVPPPPTPDTPENKLSLYPSYQAIDYVLEVSAGYADQHKLQVGDSVDLSKM